MFYSIPRKDTNPLAHRLLETFGSLKNLFNAEIEDIQKIEGAGEQTATLIKLAAELSRRYWLAENQNPKKITSIESAVGLVRSILHGRPNEQFYVICLDAQYNILNSQCISKGTSTEAPIYIRHITESVIRNGADKVLVAHNHPGGNPSPSKDDIETTIKITEAMNVLSIQFLDHIIIADNEYFSFAQHQQVLGGSSLEHAKAAQYSGRVMQQIIQKFMVTVHSPEQSD